MSKRTADHQDGPLKRGHRPDALGVDVDMDVDMDDKPAEDMGEFEDEFGDEFDSEDEIMEAGVDGRPDAEREADMHATKPPSTTFIVGRSKLEPGQTLAPDPSTYHMLHSLSTPWPCLSFDILRDGLGDNRSVYPATVYTVSGTQADGRRANENAIMVIKFSGLGKMDRGDDASDDDDDDDDDKGNDDDDDADPILESKSIPISSTTNRIRAHQAPSADSARPATTLVATMAESSDVYIHDITPHLASFDTPGTVISDKQNKPISTIRAHKAEGYALDWSKLAPAGRLATGDNDGIIYITTRTDGGGWATDTRPLTGHTGSVEEIQWSPSEDKVFSSASSDGAICIWDIRSKSRKPMINMNISTVDVNVMSWSKQRSNLLASGDDNGTWGVWDLRQWKPNAAEKPTPVASFDYHKEQITSIEWHPADDSIVAVAAGDNTITLWDLAVELDDEESKDTADVQDVPPQLLFVHYHEQAKEVHWHPQIPGTLVATGNEFSIFKTISV